MSGVLARLAQRALGATSLRPRLAGTFEPAAPEEIMAEVPEPVPAPVSPAPIGAAGLPERPRLREEPAPPVPLEQPSSAPAPWLPPPPAAVVHGLPSLTPVRDAAPAPAAAVVEQPRVPVPAPASPAIIPPGRRPLLPPLPENALPPEPVPARRTRSEASAPDVTISIGSIEFRATPQPRPAPAVSPPAPRLMSLEDYLTKGQRGRR